MVLTKFKIHRELISFSCILHYCYSLFYRILSNICTATSLSCRKMTVSPYPQCTLFSCCIILIEQGIIHSSSNTLTAISVLSCISQTPSPQEQMFSRSSAIQAHGGYYQRLYWAYLNNYDCNRLVSQNMQEKMDWTESTW